MTCRQLSQLDAPVEEEGADANEDGIGPCASNCCKSRIDLAAGAGGENLNLQPHGAPSRFNVSQSSLGGRRKGRIDEHSDTNGTGHQLTQKFQPLCRQFDVKKLIPVRLPPG